MTEMNEWERRVRRITGLLDLPGLWVGKTAAWLIIPMIGALVYEVTSRYAFDKPTMWAYDLTYMFYGTIFLLGAAYALARDQHVRADFFYNALPVRYQAVVDLCFYLVFYFPALAVFTWLTTKYALHSWEMGERIPTSPWMPIIYPYKTVMPVCGLLLLIQGVSEVIKCLYCVRTNRRFRIQNDV